MKTLQNTQLDKMVNYLHCSVILLSLVALTCIWTLDINNNFAILFISSNAVMILMADDKETLIISVFVYLGVVVLGLFQIDFDKLSGIYFVLAVLAGILAIIRYWVKGRIKVMA